ncbi:helix-turn-helix domain-containing protein [Citricoccus sp. K5]|uniref:helix-turn-helix domain-containing protein n=1 Tax=Citricoccus sp. K5 TaxID=2653135 RepID=UPI0012F0E05B|nr:helix-turn-helix domain-containing protein [Citricoccus sp. K5]VXA93029.1 hypothetical protein CITRIK5_100043 [Citricoccus sp. K5]VXA95605.1 hypothetical protein CITRIK5_100109 [Citricoccus sp. K5]
MANPLPGTIGSRIRKARETLGLNQDMFRIRLAKNGLTISQGTLSKIESGVRELRLHESPALCSTLGVTLDHLAGVADQDPNRIQVTDGDRFDFHLRSLVDLLADMNLAVSAKQHLSLQDLAERFAIPEKTLYVWRTNGSGPKGFRVGKHVRYRIEDVEAWEQEQVEAGDDR